MTKEEIINKAIELEFGSGNAKNIRAHNSSLVKVAEHLYDLMQPSLPSNLDEAAIDIVNDAIDSNDTTIIKYEGLLRYLVKAGAEWMAGQGVTLEGRVCKDDYAIEAPFYYVETENSDDLPIVGNKVVVQIRKEQ